MPTMGTSTTNTAPPLNIQVNGVKELLISQNPHKASGPDQISPRFLKEMDSSIAPALTLVYQVSYEQGQIPNDWKRAFVTPLLKTGAANYRPVSLTSCCCKVMENVEHSHLIKFLESNKILSDFRHRFLERSYETQLITTTLDFAVRLDRRQQVDASLLDLSKAFDKVPHHRLAVKLHHCGIRDKSYPGSKVSLQIGITRQIVLDGKISSPTAATSEDPQGTVLGPLLFLVYINDLPSRVSSGVRLFADYCLQHRVIRDQGPVVQN